MPQEPESGRIGQDDLAALMDAIEDRDDGPGEDEDDGLPFGPDDGSEDDGDGDGDSGDLGLPDDDGDGDLGDGEDDDDLSDDEDGDDGFDDEEEDESPRRKKPAKESLSEKAKEADQWRAWYAEQEEKRETDALRRTHDAQRAKADEDFERAIARHEAAMDAAPSPRAYYREHIKPIEDERKAWHAAFDRSAADVWRRRQLARELPQRVEHLVKALRLPPEAVDEILELGNPELMAKHAKRLAKRQQEIRALKRQASQGQREGAARALSSRGVSPGAGRGRGRREEDGTDAQLVALLNPGRRRRRR